ncbi:MAG: hypothetical protein UY50_C0015G0002 [Parcubacteria group bacterium GW2011_GWA2_49_9]|nr:MAG: hypothetical protein UY50_C0015G0002 [Parcubacteria group bacterium GW2011_GWA2_49_9]
MPELPKQIDERQLREQQVEKITDFLERIDAYQYAQNLLTHPEARDEFPFEKFKDFLVRINGIARDIPIHERRTDGEEVHLEGYGSAAVPRHKDKEGLLKEAYESLDKMSAEDRAYLLPAMINEVHLFNDGNGRTSRILHTLLHKFASEAEFKKALTTAVGRDGRFNAPDLDPSITGTDRQKIVMMRHGIKFSNDRDYSPVAPEDLRGFFDVINKPTTPNGRKLMKMRKGDGAYIFVAAYEWLKEQSLLEDSKISNGDGDFLSPVKMEQILSDSDWTEIFERYYAIKREHARLLVEAFVEPDKYKCVDGTMNLKDYFKHEVQVRWKRHRM